MRACLPVLLPLVVCYIPDSGLYCRAKEPLLDRPWRCRRGHHFFHPAAVPRTCLQPVASFAALSANSLPSTPLCDGIHRKDTVNPHSLALSRATMTDSARYCPDRLPRFCMAAGLPVVIVRLLAAVAVAIMHDLTKGGRVNEPGGMFFREEDLALVAGRRGPARSILPGCPKTVGSVCGPRMFVLMSTVQGACW
jgi:hypothetical protein